MRSDAVKAVVSNPTPATGAALRKVFGLLEDQFDSDLGAYRNGYSDERVAKETGISEDAVKNYRVSAFGKLKPPNEMFNVQRDLQELEALYIKTEKEMKEGLRDLKARINNLQKKFD